jgi:hypothetical protein
MGKATITAAAAVTEGSLFLLFPAKNERDNGTV